MASHGRKPSTRAVLPRRHTKGPLDVDDDPLSGSSSLASSTIKSPDTTLPPLPFSPGTDAAYAEPFAAPVSVESEIEVPPNDRDLSFLLEPSIYHPLSQLEIPAPFRKAFHPPLSPSASVSDAFKHIDQLLSHCEYLQAAHLAGLVLISGAVKQSDQRAIFRLLSIRYACLELSGNTTLAAQEAKALEDLGSSFYYLEEPQRDSDGQDGGPPALPRHIVPWHLRLQALRLQSIGFADPRRGVSALYDLATECREFLVSQSLSEAERKLWSARLEEIGVRVVNALIEMGDVDCARRTLNTMKPAQDQPAALWRLRKATLCLKMGLLGEVRRLVTTSQDNAAEKKILESLLAVAEGHFDQAIEMLESTEDLGDLSALAKQNLAVALLYHGDIQKARTVLEGLINQGYSFQSLTVNLATIYDLTTDRSRNLKLALVDEIAKHQNPDQLRAFTNADFKL